MRMRSTDSTLPPTFVVTQTLVKISVFIPGPIVAIAIGIFVTEFVWTGKGIVRVIDKFGPVRGPSLS